jgi:hypothetical protein
MRKNLSKQAVSVKPTKNNIVSFETALRDGWFIKLSRFDKYIMLLFVSQFTGNTIIRYFDDEDIAVQFINYVINIDPTSLTIQN